MVERRRGDVERDVVLCGENGEAVGADLVGGVAVGADPVRSDDDGVDPAVPHDTGRHVVRDERRGHAREPKLPRREATTLVDRPRLVDPHVLDLAVLVRGEDHAERGPEVDGRKRARVAVREHLGLVREQVRAETADGAVALLVLGLHVERLLDDELLELAQRTVRTIVREQPDALGAPHQVDRRGPGRGDLLGDLVEFVEILVDRLDAVGLVLGPQRERERGRNAEGRRAANRERLDGDADALSDVAGEDVALQRKPGLVDHEYDGAAGDLVLAPPDRARDVLDAHRCLLAVMPTVQRIAYPAASGTRRGMLGPRATPWGNLLAAELR